MYVILSSRVRGDPQRKKKKKEGRRDLWSHWHQTGGPFICFGSFFFLAVIFGRGGIIMIVFVNCPFLAVNFGWSLADVNVCLATREQRYYRWARSCVLYRGKALVDSWQDDGGTKPGLKFIAALVWSFLKILRTRRTIGPLSIRDL